MQAAFVQQPSGERVGRESRGPAVGPDEVGPFQRKHGELREMPREVVPQEKVVLPQVAVERVEPLGAVRVGRRQSLDGEGADHARLVDFERPGDPFPEAGVGGEDVGHLHSREVECLAGRGAGDRAARELLRKRGEGGVAESRHHQLAVDFVGHDQYVAAQADVADAAQLFGRPDPPRGVVRVAEQHQFHGRVGGPAFQRVEIDRIAVVAVSQFALRGGAPAVVDGDEEVVVDGRQHQHPVSGAGQRPENGRERRDHARHGKYPVRSGRPAVPPGKPGRDRPVVALRDRGVAVDAVLHPAAERLDDARGRAEIHVGDPHREDVGRRFLVPLHRVGSPARDQLIEIVFCHIGMHFIYKDTKKSDRCKTSGYLLIRYADGVMPVWLRKYLPKNDWLGKLRQ